MRWLVFVAAAVFAQEQADLNQLQKSARAAYAKSDYAAARAALEQAWEIAQQMPPESQQRYDVLKQLSTVLSAAGDYASAQKYVDPKIADEYIDLSSLCRRQKDFSRALDLLGKSLRIHSKQGSPNLLMADDLSRIALIYMDQHKPAESAPPLETAIQFREQVLGADHPAIRSSTDWARSGSLCAITRKPKKPFAARW